MSLEEEIKSHTDRVEAGEPVRYLQACPGCGSEGPFRMHDCRRRTFRVVVDGYVKVFHSGLWRWNCTRCGKRFTEYPPLPCRTSVS